METRELIRLVNNVAELQFRHIACSEATGAEYLKEFKEAEEKIQKVISYVQANVSNEFKRELNKLSDMIFNLAQISGEHYFKQGIKEGAGALNFLKDTEVLALM